MRTTDMETVYDLGNKMIEALLKEKVIDLKLLVFVVKIDILLLYLLNGVARCWLAMLSLLMLLVVK